MGYNRKHDISIATDVIKKSLGLPIGQTQVVDVTHDQTKPNREGMRNAMQPQNNRQVKEKL